MHNSYCTDYGYMRNCNPTVGSIQHGGPGAVPDERKHYKKITEVIAVLYVVAALLADYTEHSGVLSSISVSAFVEGMLLIIGKLLSVRHGIPVTHEAGI